MINKSDYRVYLSDKDIDMILEEDHTLLDEAELTAQAVVSSALGPYYDIDIIYQNINDHRQVKRWLIVLAIYYVYERVPDRLVPERVVKNYDDVLVTLDRIMDKKISVHLPTKQVEDDTKPITKFRWGSSPKKTQSV